MNKNILITGGTGFIGSSLAIELQKLNNLVTLYDINCKNTFYLEYPLITFVYGDTNETEKLKHLLENSQFDGIIHLAAVSRVAVAQNDPEECVRTNINGTKSLLHALESSKQKKMPWLIFGSSREVYGEPDSLPVTETFEQKYVNIYGRTKIEGEYLFKQFAIKHKISCFILRFSNVYGNQFDLLERVIPKFINAIDKDEYVEIEGGNQIIDFTHIDDTVNTVILAIKYISSSNKMIDDFHILPGIGYSLDDVISLIEKYLGKKAKIHINQKRTYDVEKFIGNPEKIKTIFKTQTFLTLEQGLEIAIPKYLEVLK